MHTVSETMPITTTEL